MLASWPTSTSKFLIEASIVWKLKSFYWMYFSILYRKALSVSSSDGFLSKDRYYGRLKALTLLLL